MCERIVADALRPAGRAARGEDDESRRSVELLDRLRIHEPVIHLRRSQREDRAALERVVVRAVTQDVQDCATRVLSAQDERSCLRTLDYLGVIEGFDEPIELARSELEWRGARRQRLGSGRGVLVRDEVELPALLEVRPLARAPREMDTERKRAGLYEEFRKLASGGL